MKSNDLRIFWTKEQDETMARMLAEGAKLPAIAEAIGRTAVAIKCRRRYLSLSVEQRSEENRAWKAANRPAGSRKSVRGRVAPPADRFLPPGALEDAQRRLYAPRSLTAVLCGDPAPGRSALDRKLAGASA